MNSKSPQDSPRFELVRKILSNCPHINRGGCAVSAYIMYRFLRLNGWGDAQIVYAYDDGHDCYDCNDTFLTLGGGVASSCAHAYVEIPSLWLSIDCDEIRKEIKPNRIGSARRLKEFHDIPHELVEEFIVKSMMMPEEWNHYFNRRNIPLLALKMESMGIPVPALMEISRNDAKLKS